DPFDVLLILVAAADLTVCPVTFDATIRLGGRLGIAVVSVGALDGCRCIAVDEDGTVTDALGGVAAGDRLHMLSEAEASEFLAVLAASRGADIPEVEDVAAIEAADVPDTVAEQELRAAPDGVERPVELRVVGHPPVLAGG